MHTLDCNCHHTQVCGILTEMERDSVVVGIGCNVSYVPSIDEVGPDAGRVATSLSSFRHSLPALQEDAARDLGRMIAHAVNYEYLDGPGDSGEHVTADFTEQLDRAPQRLRANGSQGREVLPCGVNADGSLRVCMQQRETEEVVAYARVTHYTLWF